MDILYIDQLTIMAKIGIHDWEKKSFQKLIFDLQICYDKAFYPNYLDYTKINQVILDTMSIKHFFLIEEVAETISEKLINDFPIISRIQVKVNKPGAICNARNVGICINRKKNFSKRKKILFKSIK